MKFFKTAKNKKGEEHFVTIVFDEKGRLSYLSNCTCPYGSFYRWSEANKKDKWMCRHIVREYAKILKMSPMRAREILIKQGIMDPTHLKKI
jgi:hypothetical protein